MPKPWYQRALVFAGYFLGGIAFLGGLLDAINNSLQLISPDASRIGTVLLLGAVLGVHVWMKYHPVRWTTHGQSIHLQRPGVAFYLVVFGMVVLLWAPRVMETFAPPPRPPQVVQSAATNPKPVTSDGSSKIEARTPNTIDTRVENELELYFFGMGDPRIAIYKGEKLDLDPGQISFSEEHSQSLYEFGYPEVHLFGMLTNRDYLIVGQHKEGDPNSADRVSFFQPRDAAGLDARESTFRITMARTWGFELVEIRRGSEKAVVLSALEGSAGFIYVEVFLKLDGRYIHIPHEDYNKGIGKFGFADLDEDGTMELIMLTSDSKWREGEHQIYRLDLKGRKYRYVNPKSVLGKRLYSVIPKIRDKSIVEDRSDSR